MSTNPFNIRYTQKANEDLDALRAFEQKKVIDGIEKHLQDEPTKTSRSRIKQMTPPFWSQYRLRVDDFRVYYDVDESTRSVTVLRVIEKGRAQTLDEAES
jgi:mRNA interferase RelE/StbE